MIGFDEACARVALLAKPLGAERINLDEAAGRVLAAPVIAPRACPAAATAAMTRRRIAIVVAAEVRSAPVVMEKIPGGTAFITFSEEREAEAVAKVLAR